MPKNRKNTRLISYSYLLLNTFCWGAAFIIVKPAFTHITPFRFLFYRFAFAATLALPILIYFLKKIKISGITLLRIVVLEAIGGSLALGILYLGLDRTSAIEASLLANTVPIFTTIAGIILLKEKEEGHEWLGLGLAFLGTVMMTFLPIFNGFAMRNHISLTGNLMIIVHNILTALYYTQVKKHYKKLPKFFVTSISFYVSLIIFGAFFFWENGQMQMGFWEIIKTDFQNISVWVATLYMAIFGSVIGLTAYIKGQDGIEASEAALFTYLQPLIYIPLGIMLLGESVSPTQLISLVVILAGVIIAERRPKTIKKR